MITATRSLILVRGLPGSGKTTLAKLIVSLVEDGAAVAADDFFEDEEGNYQFDPTRLQEVHEKCQETVHRLMRDGYSVLVVHNTFSQRWEMERYIRMARDNKYQLHVIDLFNAGLSIDQLVERNTHGVPYAAVHAMWERWQRDWRTDGERQAVKFRPGNYRPETG